MFIASEWEYIAEGALHIILAYNGQKSELVWWAPHIYT